MTRSEVLAQMVLFEKAMVEAGYDKPKRNKHDDGYWFASDSDIFLGWMLTKDGKAKENGKD